jgi:hypothetical protein
MFPQVSLNMKAEINFRQSNCQIRQLGGIKMNVMKLIPAVLVLCVLIGPAIAESDTLSPDDTAAKEDISAAMDEDIFKTKQDVQGEATPVVTGKNLPAASVEVNAPEPQERLLSPTNIWSFNLIDNQERSVVLQMSQSQNAIWGKGIIAVDDAVQNATATGTVNGDKVNLDILTNDLTLFRLSLTMNKKSLSGDYHGYSTIYTPWKGIAMGKIN